MAATRPRAAKPRARKPQPKRAQRRPDLTDNPQVRAILGGPVIDTVFATLTAIDRADEEIARAQREHPEHADRLWHSCKLMRPTHPLLYREQLHRAHVRELLARVVAGGDTRPGTAAECLIACCQTSLQAPLNTAAHGLYLRMWRLAGLPEIDPDGEHYEARYGPSIDELDHLARGRLRVPSRQLPKRIEHCPGCPDWRGTTEQLTLALTEEHLDR